ncbi:hypothetical protein [Teichococcus aestuarii]
MWRHAARLGVTDPGAIVSLGEGRRRCCAPRIWRRRSPASAASCG